MNNFVFFKSMENVRLRKDIKLCNERRAVNYAKNPQFKMLTMFEEDFIACHIEKTNIQFDKPIYIRFIVLNLSKHFMYNF